MKHLIDSETKNGSNYSANNGKKMKKVAKSTWQGFFVIYANLLYNDSFRYIEHKGPLQLFLGTFYTNTPSLSTIFLKSGRRDFRAKNLGFKTCVIVGSVNNTGTQPDEDR